MTRPAIHATTWRYGLPVWLALAFTRFKSGRPVPSLRKAKHTPATSLRSCYVTWYSGNDTARAVIENAWGSIEQITLAGDWPDIQQARRIVQKALFIQGGAP
jgi:hypothetical protein